MRRPNSRTLVLALPFLILFLFNAVAISHYDAQATEKNVRWNYVSDYSEVERVREVLMTYRMRISNEKKAELAEFIVGYSNAYAIDTYFVLALIKKESTFNNYARSKSHAHGLMQLRVATAKSVAKELGVKWQGRKMLYDPLVNVRFGIHYLSSVLERFDNDKKLALIAYNHGPARLSWRLRTGRHTNFKFVEKIYSDYSNYKLQAYNK